MFKVTLIDRFRRSHKRKKNNRYSYGERLHVDKAEKVVDQFKYQ